LCTAATIFFAITKKTLYGGFIHALGFCGEAFREGKWSWL
jgi:hypothetical protein